ncbi:MAG: hypothetical protein ACOWW1_07160 [archaeon]
MKILLQKVKCGFCGYVWTPRSSQLRKCPNPKCQKYFEKPDDLEIVMEDNE